jgi:hypothetical protein
MKKSEEVTSSLDLPANSRTLGACFKQEPESNASIDGTHLKEEALHIAG